jgi:hypothetical protein
MVDLQRPIGLNEVPFAAGFKSAGKKSDTGSSADSRQRQKFFAPDSRENFIRSKLMKIEMEPCSVSTRLAGTGPVS